MHRQQQQQNSNRTGMTTMTTTLTTTTTTVTTNTSINNKKQQEGQQQHSRESATSPTSLIVAEYPRGHQSGLWTCVDQIHQSNPKYERTTWQQLGVKAVTLLNALVMCK